MTLDPNSHTAKILIGIGITLLMLAVEILGTYVVETWL